MAPPHTFYIFILKQYCGPYYPIELIQLIIMATNAKTIKISCGLEYVFIMTPNKIYGFGSDPYDKLGLALALYEKYGRSNIKKIICGRNHSFALTNNSNKILSMDNLHENFSEKIKRIRCGSDHAVLLTVFGSMYVIGSNGNGELGLVDYLDRSSYTKHSLGNIKKIYSGYRRVFVLNNSLECYCWGLNGRGQLGIGNIDTHADPQKLNLANIVTISCGLCHTVAITSDGTYAWGSNDFGELGLGDSNSIVCPYKIKLDYVISVRCGGDHTIALTNQGRVYVWGKQFKNKILFPRQIHMLSRIKSIYCTMNNNFAVSEDNRIYGWGPNKSGVLGLGHRKKQPEPIELKL